jgi:hypothetical protein
LPFPFVVSCRAGALRHESGHIVFSRLDYHLIYHLTKAESSWPIFLPPCAGLLAALPLWH